MYLLTAYSLKLTAAVIPVSTPQQLKEVLTKVQPGDTILLDKGQWKNVALQIETNGTKEKPVVIAAAEPGAVEFTGNSYIQFGSNHVVVSGILFTNGFTEKGATVEAVQLMRKYLPEHVQIKASGGIRTPEFAQQLIEAGATRLGCSASVAIVNGLPSIANNY